MATTTTSVKKAFDTQDDLKSRREHCAVAARTLASLDRVRGQQVRVHHDAEYALYTVSELLHETTSVRRAHGAARAPAASGRTGSSPASSTRRSPIPTSATRTPAPPASSSSGSDDGSHPRLIAIAPHGGDIEPHTDEQAEPVATASDRSWRQRLAVQGLGEEPRRLRPLAHHLHRHRPGQLPAPRHGGVAALRRRRRLPRLRRRSGSADRRDGARPGEGARPGRHRTGASGRSDVRVARA